MQHSLVADRHYSEYEPAGWPDVPHLVNVDGALRKGHEAFTEFCL